MLIVIMFMFITIVFILIINTSYYAPFVYPKKKKGIMPHSNAWANKKKILNEEKNFQEFIKIEQLKDYKSEK